MDVYGMIAAVKEAAERSTNQEAAKAMKKQVAKTLRDKIEQLEAVCEAEFEREMAMLREMRRNLPSSVANLTIGQIREAGGYFGPDEKGNACFEIPAHLYRPASSAADPSETEKTVVASAKKMIQIQTQSKRMSKRTRSVLGTPGSTVKSKVPKLQAATAVRHSVRQSTRTLRSTVKGKKNSNASQSSVSASFLSSTEEPTKGSQKSTQNKNPRETQFEDALDGFASSQETAVKESAVKGKKKTTRNSKTKTPEAVSASAATGAATANTTVTGTAVDEVQQQLMNMSIANPRTPTGKHRILSKPVRLPKENEPVVTIHVSKDGTPLLISKKQLVDP